MRIAHLEADAGASAIRALASESRDVEVEVRAIVDDVRRDGDAAVRRLTERFDRAELGPGEIAVPPREVEAALGVLGPEVTRSLRTAIANVRRVAEGQRFDRTVVELPEGQQVELADVPVRRAGIYVPGGRAPYPSTLVMCAVTAQVAGVDEIAVCAPPGPAGHAHPLVLGACALCGLHEVYRMGGAQAIAALAYGTASVGPVDVIVGPGNRYVQEAKRQVAFRQVGIDGMAGPSELTVVAAGEADAKTLALDLLAQAEHGSDGLLALVSPDERLLSAVERELANLAAARPSANDAPLVLVRAPSAPAAVRLADDVAPEHLQLVGAEAEPLANRVRTAGCVFVGPGAGTAFGDYVAGSNHVLPTGGAARFQGSLSPSTFGRRMARVSLPGDAPRRLAPAGAALARAEGFPVHAESMERRA